jgi:hypothetical protein
MELILIYSIFAVIVAFMACVDLYYPVLNKLDYANIPGTKNIYYATFFLVSLLVAPFLVYPCLSGMKGVEFRDALYKVLSEKQ